MLSLLRANRKCIATITIWMLIGLGVAFYVQCCMFFDCDVEAIVKHIKRALQDAAAASESDGCTFARNDSRSRSHQLPETNWCMYEDEVDLRIIIMTFNRPESLLRLLSSVSDLEMDGDSVAMEIWIDRNGRNVVDEPTLLTARSFRWRYGRVRVHVHRSHVGIYGQWMATWRPRNASTRETALFLEDDLDISPFTYRWLSAARRFYADRRDVAGFTLQSEGLIRASDGGRFTPPPAAVGAAFLYALIGSWGFAPRPDVWIGFQDWYAGVTASGQHKLRPLVPGLILSQWYKSFQRTKKTHTMWTMWFTYYSSQVRRQLYTIYNNVHSVAAAISPKTDERYICVNRREPGLHYSKKPTAVTHNKLIRMWRPVFANFRRTPPVFNYTGKQEDRVILRRLH